MEILKGAKDFTRNPLGIIALFICLIYGFSCLLLNSSAEKLTGTERWPLIVFIVVFPIMVLTAFYRLVTNHHVKLYAPSDFKDDKTFLRTLSPEEQEKKLEKEIKESLGESECEDVSESCTRPSSEHIANNSEREKRRDEYRRFREELQAIENKVIKMIASEYKVEAVRNIGIGDTDSRFDAMLSTTEPLTFIEVKVLRSPALMNIILDRLLYHAVVADKFFESNFKLIIVVVYYFNDNELERVERIWRRKVDKCPANIELRFIPKSKILNA